MSTFTVKQALNYGFNELSAQGGRASAKIDSARLDAEILLCFVLGCAREKLILNTQYPIPNIQFNKYKKLIEKRQNNWPIAYLVGRKEFYGIDFYINKNVLVPRPETELLIDAIMNYESRIMNHGLKILEIGTGSGCIAITLAKYLPNAKITSTDISNKALYVARKNLKKLKLKTCLAGRQALNLKFKKSDLLSNIKTLPDIIVANLPYLTKEELKEPSISREPKTALYGGKDGLALYEKLFRQIKQKIYHGKVRPCHGILIFAEIGENQGCKIKKMIKSIFPEAEIEIKKDLANRNRVVIIKQKFQ